MEMPLVSIITPTYNSEKYIAAAILSVQDQTLSDWEMILVDDSSTDTTEQIILGFTENDSRIKFHKLEVNSGTGVARNTAITLAKGSYIAFLDSDDLWKPSKLERQIDFLRTNNLPFTFSFYDCIDEQGKSINRRVTAPKNLKYSQLFFCNYVGNLTGIYEVNYFGKIPVSNSKKRQDWMLWLTILKKIKTAQPVTESLACYRIRENSISASKLNLVKHNFAVYRNFHGYNFMVSTLCMIGFLYTQLLIKPHYIKKVI